MLPLSTIFLLDFGTVPNVWYFLFLSIVLLFPMSYLEHAQTI